jgi:hypothetical protein
MKQPVEIGDGVHWLSFGLLAGNVYLVGSLLFAPWRRGVVCDRSLMSPKSRPLLCALRLLSVRSPSRSPARLPL